MTINEIKICLLGFIFVLASCGTTAPSTTDTNVLATAQWLKAHKQLRGFKGDLSLANAPQIKEHLEKIHKVSFISEQVDRDGFKNLIHLPNLTQITDIKTNLTDQDYAPLSGLTKLIVLDLNASNITDAGMVHFQNMNLSKVVFYNTTITDKGLKILGDMNNLVQIGLSEHITDQGLSHLKNLKKVKVLGLFNSKITDDGLKFLDQMTELEELYISDTAITDKGLASLAKFKKLQIIDIQGTKITKAGARAFQAILKKCVLHSRFD